NAIANTLHAGVQKARNYQPTWTPYVAKGPQFFTDSKAYVASRKKPVPYKGHEVATAGKAKHKAHDHSVAKKKPEQKSKKSGIIKIADSDFDKILAAGRKRALAYHPKWHRHVAKAPEVSAEVYARLTGRKAPTPYQGHATATVGRGKHKHHVEEPGLVYL